MTVVAAFLLHLLVLVLALLLDLILGEPPEKFHPTVWMGRVITVFEPVLRGKSPSKARIGGIFLWFICMAIFTVPTAILVTLSARFLGAAGYVVVSALILKITFALKSWDNHMIPVVRALESKNIDIARKLVQKTVRRDLSNSDEQHIVSASVETIAEGIVDGFASPILYFSLFAAPGAMAYRVTNTLDSMVGYKDQEHMDLGWFSAKMDTIANYLPARIIGYTILFASTLLGKNWTRSKNTFVRYRGTIESLNSGWPMSAMAGALGIKLEKAGHYKLGESYENLTVNHIRKALNVMKATCVVFIVIVIVPLIFANHLIQRLMVTV